MVTVVVVEVRFEVNTTDGGGAGEICGWWQRMVDVGGFDRWWWWELPVVMANK